MRKIFVMLLSMLIIFSLTACGEEEKNNSAEQSVDRKILVAYFSCTGTTKALAENAANILSADLYEIKPKIPYTAEDLDWHDETTRATVEQKDDTARPELEETTADFSAYDTIVIAYPIWWGTEPRIIDTFVEIYNFDNKTLVPICTSGGTDIVTSADNLKMLASFHANWKDGKCFFKNNSSEELQKFFSGIGLK